MINTIIVEDNIYMQNHLSSMLAGDERFNLIASLRDAFEAEKVCKTENVDLVLMDVQTLHNHSGLAAGERIRKSGHNTKIIIVTSLIDPEVLAKAKMYADFEPQFSSYVVCGHLVETLTGVTAEAFCEEAIKELATDNHMSVEELVERSGKYACYDKLLQDKALALLATYTEQFLED